MFELLKTLVETPEETKARKQKEKQAEMKKKKADNEAWEEIIFQDMMDDD